MPDATLSSKPENWAPTYRICRVSKVERMLTRASNLSWGGNAWLSAMVLKTAMYEMVWMAGSSN